jgi:hypothetical protein
MESSEDSGYRYFNSLLINKEFLNALKNDYMLFFVRPFDHNARLTSSIEEISPILTALEANPEELSQLDELEKAILYFYLNEPQKSLDHLNSYLSLKI